MSSYALYRDPVVLDYTKHARLRLAPATDHSAASNMSVCFLAAAEFASAARDFVIMFSRERVGGDLQVQPLVLLGLVEGENLFLDGARWDARYVPAYIRRHPFWTTLVEGMTEPVLMIDQAWPGFSDTTGDPLYDGENKPARRLADAVQFVKQFELEAGRTLTFGQRLSELGLLREMTATVKLANGQEFGFDGLMTVDDAKLHQLPDARVLELHRNGMLGLIHAHQMSLANMQSLVDRKARRAAAH